MGLNKDLASLVVFSEDFTLAGTSISLQVKIDHEEIATQLLTVNINFETIPPELDTSKFTSKPITCGLADASWSMTIPSVIDADSQNVEVELLTDSDIFSYNKESSMLILKRKGLIDVVSGDLCRENKIISLEFGLKSDELGESTQKLQITILKTLYTE